MIIRIIAIGVLVGGIVLTVFGVDASQSFGSEVSKVFTGNPTDRAMWMIGGGVAMIVAGAVGVFVGGKKR